MIIKIIIVMQKLLIAKFTIMKAVVLNVKHNFICFLLIKQLHAQMSAQKVFFINSLVS